MQVALVEVAPIVVLAETDRAVEGFAVDALVDADVAARRVDAAVRGLKTIHELDARAEAGRLVVLRLPVGMSFEVCWMTVPLEASVKDSSSDKRDGRDNESHFIKSLSENKKSKDGGD